MKNKEMVDHPQHYNFNGYECLDVMVAVFGKEKVMDFCKINSFKYLWRSEQKNGAEDLKKARWYMNYWYQLCESETLMNQEMMSYVEADSKAVKAVEEFYNQQQKKQEEKIETEKEEISRPIESLNRSEDVFDTVVVDDAEQSWLNIMQENEIDYEEEFHFEEATYDFEGMTTVYKFSVEGPDVHHLHTYLHQTSMQRGVRNEFVRSDLRPDQFYDLCNKSCMTFITGKFITHDIEKEVAIYNKKSSDKNEILNDPCRSLLYDFNITIDEPFSVSEDGNRYRIHWDFTDKYSLETSFRVSKWQKYKGNTSDMLAQFRENGIFVKGELRHAKK